MVIGGGGGSEGQTAMGKRRKRQAKHTNTTTFKMKFGQSISLTFREGLEDRLKSKIGVSLDRGAQNQGSMFF